jgi:hypothetical protein
VRGFANSLNFQNAPGDSFSGPACVREMRGVAECVS